MSDEPKKKRKRIRRVKQPILAYSTNVASFVCDACGKQKEEGLDHCPCLEGTEWLKKAI